MCGAGHEVLYLQVCHSLQRFTANIIYWLCFGCVNWNLFKYVFVCPIPFATPRHFCFLHFPACHSYALCCSLMFLFLFQFLAVFNFCTSCKHFYGLPFAAAVTQPLPLFLPQQVALWHCPHRNASTFCLCSQAFYCCC